MKELESVAAELNGRIMRKRRLGSLRAVMTRGKVEWLQKRLCEAKLLLILSGQVLDRCVTSACEECNMLKLSLEQYNIVISNCSLSSRGINSLKLNKFGWKSPGH